MIRVQLKASSAIMRTGIEQMLLSEPGFHIIPDDREARNDRHIADEEPPDVVIAEVEDAFEEAGWSDLLDAGGPETAILLLVDDPASLSAAEALRSGVRGVLPTRASRDELVAAVHAAAAGLVVIHPDNASTVLPARPRDAGKSNALIEPLTSREMEVLAILAEGGSNKEIASRLSISEHTAKFHVASIMGKLGATSRTEAVTLAIRGGLIMV
jgi:two-component system, NarL family, response regulator YdfI